MAGADIVKLGQFNWASDALAAHPASPTGAILDLNDGSTFTLMDQDSSGMGTGLMLSPAQPRSYYAGNPRTTGKIPTRRVYEDNRQIVVRLDWNGRSGTYASWITNMHNLVQLVEGITPTQPGCLQLTTTGSAITQYADIVDGFVEDQYKALMWAQQLDTLIVVFTIRPFLRRAAVVCENLVMNPGFETPYGGTGGSAATTAPIGFADTFANVNAYTVQTGGAPTTAPAKTYKDIIFDDAANIYRYYPLNEASGTTAYDIGGQALHGTNSGTITLGASALQSTSTDTSYAFTAASGKITLPTGAAGNISTGNGAFSVHALVARSSAPAANSIIVSWGANTSKNGFRFYIDTAGKLNAEVGAGTGLVTGAANICDGTARSVVATWDGTTLTIYVNGSSTGTPTTPGALSVGSTPPVYIGADQSGTATCQHTQSQIVFYSTALSGARASALSTARTSLSGTLSSTILLTSGSRLGFGSPAWSAYQTWQARFRYITSQTSVWYLHFTDANNWTRVSVISGTMHISQDVSGVTTDITTVTPTLTHEAWYWLRITQYPSPSGVLPYVTATLYYDDASAVGTAVTNGATSTTLNAGAVVVGAPAIQSTGATMALGGVSTGNQVTLFGPGAWSFFSTGAGTASGAWDGTRAGLGQSGTATAGTQTYPNGPVTSAAALRIDAAPAGALTAQWRPFSGGSPTGTPAIPVRTSGDVMYAGAQAKSSGLANNATIKLNYTEYDASGTSLATGTLQTFTVSGGVQAAYAASGTYTLTGHWTTGSGGTTAYVDLQIQVADATAGSANATVWIDNVQVWNSTATGAVTMSYHEMRFANSPATLVVSGLVGDVPAPALMSVGTYDASIASSTTLYFLLGRRASSSLSPPYTTLPRALSAPVLDSTSYGGWYDVQTGAQYSFPIISDGTASTLLGAYEVLLRAQQSDATTSRASVQVIITDASGIGSSITGAATLYPFSAANTWTWIDGGRINVPSATVGVLTDLTGVNETIYPQYNDSNGSITWRHNFIALLPVDGGIGVCSIANTSGGILSSYNYPTVYWQGINYGPRHAYGQPGFNTPSSSLAVNTGVVGATGNTLSFISRNLTFNSLADPWLSVDPTIAAGTNLGVNEFVAAVYDSAANVYGAYGSLRYSPLDIHFR